MKKARHVFHTVTAFLVCVGSASAAVIFDVQPGQSPGLDVAWQSHFSDMTITEIDFESYSSGDPVDGFNVGGINVDVDGENSSNSTETLAIYQASNWRHLPGQ